MLDSAESYRVDALSFDVGGQRYAGEGILYRETDESFRLEAPIRCTGPVHPVSPLSDRGTKVVTSIRMSLDSGQFAVAPFETLRDHWVLKSSGWLGRNLDSVVFYRRGGLRVAPAGWDGVCVFRLAEKPTLPDRLTVVSELNKRKVEENWQRGIDYASEDRLTWIVGDIRDDEYLRLHWGLPWQKYSQGQAWRWAEYLRRALSLVLGQTVQMVHRHAGLHMAVRTEVRPLKEPKLLRAFGPFYTTTLFPVAKEVVYRLAAFFASETLEAKTTAFMFDQMVEASQQRTMRAAEFLHASILEGALRTLDAEPFEDGKWGWKCEKSMEQFRERRLGNEWRAICDKVLKVRSTLRHRSAHPDWYFVPGDYRNTADRSLSFYPKISLLSRFYGVMILVLAGYTGLSSDSFTRLVEQLETEPGWPTDDPFAILNEGNRDISPILQSS